MSAFLRYDPSIDAGSSDLAEKQKLYPFLKEYEPDIKLKLIGLPQETCDIVRPVVRKHDQKEANSNENHPSQFHSHEVGSIQNYIQSWR